MTHTTFTYLLAAFCLAIMPFTLHAETDTEHVRLTNLPHMYVNTFSGASITDKNNYVYAKAWYVDENDNVQSFDSLSIRVRGNSTANMAKKPYKLKFHEKVKLLGKGHPNTKKWTMLANHADKTMLRNAITSIMGERAGLAFNPAAKFVDLTVNDRYAGTYQLSDQVDVRPHRVNIVEQDYPLTPTSNITGGYLLEADGFHDFTTGWDGRQATGFNSSRGVPVRIHYPDEEEINDSQVEYISNYVNSFESHLFGNSFSDATAGYRPLVDSLSLARWYICTEISANVDGFFSCYFYKEQDDPRLHFGPLWDYDIAYNNDNRTRDGTDNTERQLMFESGYGYGNGNRAWVIRMWEDPWFAQLVNREFNDLVAGGLETHLNEKIDSLVTLIDESQQLNYNRWRIDIRNLRERVLHSTYNEYIADLRTFIRRHLEYLSRAFASLLPEGPEPEPTPDQIEPDFTADDAYFYTIENVGTGTFADIDGWGETVCANHRDNRRQSQQWRIYNLANGYVRIRNSETRQCLCDDSPDGATATTETGALLTLADADDNDPRQQWNLVSRGDGIYNIISRSSQHAANLSGGNSANGTPIISYTSDERNASSNNRLWRIEKADLTTPVKHVGTDYALAYDQQSGRLHFGAEDISELTFTVAIYNQAGQRIASFPANAEFNMSTLPEGLYIVTWQHDNRQRTVKFMR